MTDDLTPTERRWRELVPPEATPSSRGVYERLERWSSGNLPGVDVAYDPLREQHWAYAALVADFASHAPAEDARVLDLGPGDGWPSIPIAQALPRATVLGVDPSPRRVRVCRANGARLDVRNAAFVAGEGDRLPLRDASIDLAVASYSLEECADADAAMRELARVLRPGGVLRVQSQVWELPEEDFETVGLIQGAEGPLLVFTRRTLEPARERRYVLLLEDSREARAAHLESIVEAAEGVPAYGEADTEEAMTLRILERLAPFARASSVVELRRWTPDRLVEDLLAAGFSEAYTTPHSGNVARVVCRNALDVSEDTARRAFDETTKDIGRTIGHERDEGDLVTAVR